MFDGVVRVTGFDHVVLVVADVERSLRWYCDVLGLAGVRVDEWRRGEAPFVSVRVDDSTIIDLVAGDRTGANVDHICLVIAPTDLDALVASGAFDVAAGPAELFGAQGMGRGFYVRDPDGNVVELRCYE
jgi:catechol 2,3-dioxygenase-like lactoylglutathione lyase family enzyme